MTDSEATPPAEEPAAQVDVVPTDPVPHVGVWNGEEVTIAPADVPAFQQDLAAMMEARRAARNAEIEAAKAAEQEGLNP